MIGNIDGNGIIVRHPRQSDGDYCRTMGVKQNRCETQSVTRGGERTPCFGKLKQFDEQRERNGFVPIADKETVERVYTAYHALGGNGVGTEITNKIRTCASSRGGNETKAET